MATGIDLGKQVGPLPLGAWIAVVGGGLGLAWYTMRQQNSATEDPGVDTSGVPGVGDGSVGGWVATNPSDTGSGGGNTPQTNEQWAVQAINWLIAQGYDGTESDSAIRKYIAGSDPAPSVKEWALISLALAKFGSPPNPLPPPVNERPPVTKPRPSRPTPEAPNNGGIKPPGSQPPVTQPPPAQNPPAQPPASQVRWYTVAKGDNLWNIASRYYGNGLQYTRIYNANRSGVRRPDGSIGMISNPNLIQPGWRLHIPN